MRVITLIDVSPKGPMLPSHVMFLMAYPMGGNQTLRMAVTPVAGS